MANEQVPEVGSLWLDRDRRGEPRTVRVVPSGPGYVGYVNVADKDTPYREARRYYSKPQRFLKAFAPVVSAQPAAKGAEGQSNGE